MLNCQLSSDSGNITQWFLLIDINLTYEMLWMIFNQVCEFCKFSVLIFGCYFGVMSLYRVFAASDKNY